jgi:AsmA protein
MLKWLLIAVGLLAGLAVAAVVALPWLLDTPAVQAQVAQAVSHALGRPVRFASLSVSALPVPTVRLKDLRVAEDPAFGTGPFVTVGEGRIHVRLWPLLSGRVELADLTLMGPRIALVKDAAGHLNIASLGVPAHSPPSLTRSGGSRSSSGTSAGAVLLSSLRIVDGSVQYQALGEPRPILSLRQINVTVTQSAPAEPLRLAGEAIAEPGSVRLRTTDARITPAGSRLLGDTALRATVTMEAVDVGPLGAAFVSSPAVSGPMTGRIDVTGTPARLSATGAISLDRITLSAARAGCGPEPRRLAIEAVRMPLVASPMRFDSAPVEAKVARGTVSLRASMARGGVPTASLTEISVKGMDLGPVLVDYLCQPYAVTGLLDLSGEAILRLPDIRPPETMRGVDGSGRIKIGPGKVVGREVVNLVRDVVGLGSAVSAAVNPGRSAVRSPLDFDSITATYTVASGVARTEDLVYTARDVRVRAAGTYGLGDRRVAMEVTLTEGANQIKGLITGAPGSLRVVPTGVRVRDRDVKKFLDRLFR